VRAAFVAARDEAGTTGPTRTTGRYFSESRNNVFAAHRRRVCRWANQHEVVVHHGPALDGKTIGNELFFSRRVVYKQHVGIAPAAHVQRLAGALGNHFHIHTSGFFKGGQQVGEQAGLLGGGGGRQHNRLRMGGGIQKCTSYY
jgi:hypothetical protein